MSPTCCRHAAVDLYQNNPDLNTWHYQILIEERSWFGRFGNARERGEIVVWQSWYDVYPTRWESAFHAFNPSATYLPLANLEPRRIYPRELDLQFDRSFPSVFPPGFPSYKGVTTWPKSPGPILCIRGCRRDGARKGPQRSLHPLIHQQRARGTTKRVGRTARPGGRRTRPLSTSLRMRSRSSYHQQRTW